MGWTHPRLLASKKEWYKDNFDHEGPACYEIGTGGPRGNAWHYVGETVNEKKRMSRYGADGSHLSKKINYPWRFGGNGTSTTNACACPSKGAAKQMQDNLLGRWVRLEPRGELTALSMRREVQPYLVF